jgi:type II secretory ATPase GspE/PulE/Tfp pilus assembly ATPase PilB-like protein
MIVENAGDDAIKQQAVNEGMRTLRKSGEDEVLNGTTTIDELRRLIDMRIE